MRFHLSHEQKERGLVTIVGVAVIIIIWLLLRKHPLGGNTNVELGGVTGPTINIGGVEVGGFVYDPADYSWLFGDNTETHADCSCGCSDTDNSFFAGLQDAMNSYIAGMNNAQTAYLQAMWGDLPPSFTQYLLDLSPNINNPASWGS